MPDNKDTNTQTDNSTNESSGDFSVWMTAIKAVADWYQHNINEYNQSGYHQCPVVSAKVRSDCSGFVSACLQKLGAISNTTIYSSADYASPSGACGKALLAAGFQNYPYSFDDLREGDIYSKGGGHVEIYAGSSKAYAWGSNHNVNSPKNPGLPTWMSKQGYTIIWRYKGGGTLGGDPGSGGSGGVLIYGGDRKIDLTKYSNIESGENKVYKLAGANERISERITAERKNEFASLKETLLSNTPTIKRDIIISDALYDSNILKGSQEAKTFVQTKGNDTNKNKKQA